MVRVADFTTYHVRIPLKKEIKHASHARTSTDSLVVRCQLDDGTVGWGEGLPRAYVTGETIDQAWDLLGDFNWKRKFGAAIDSLTGAVSQVADIPWAVQHDSDRGVFGNSARCAIELSFLDAACRHLQVPLSAVTAATPETIAIRHSVRQVRYSAAFTSMKPWKQRLLATMIRLAGFQQVKVKVGVAGVDDVALLSRIRHWLGAAIDIRLDANEAWTCANIVEKMTPLLPLKISAVEQPVPHAEVSGLARVREQLHVPIMLDESLCGEIDARRAIDQGTCDLFNLRISKCGGFVATLKLAALAHQGGFGYQLGCQVGETGILSAAGRHFATSVANIRYLEGSYDRFLVRERLTREDLTWGLGGIAPTLDRPGLGVTIDSLALQRVTQRERTFSVL